jgi:radical SAM family protein
VADPQDNSESRRHENTPLDGGSNPSSTSGKIRVLFGTTGWPSGILDVASWARHAGLAEPVIHQIRPGYAFQLRSEDIAFLAQGSVHPEIVDSFALKGTRLTDGATVRRASETEWDIRDDETNHTYRLTKSSQGVDVTVRENIESSEFQRALQEFARRTSSPAELLREDGSPTAALHEALLTLGGHFIRKLIEFRPHLVGFRIEAGLSDQVKGFVRATRLFSNAAIVLGGPTATSHPLEVLELTMADYVFAGEAEESFNQFLQLSRLPNSAWFKKGSGTVVRSTRRAVPATVPDPFLNHTANSRDLLSEVPGLAYWRDGRGRSPVRLHNEVRPVTSAEVINANRLDFSLLEGFDGEFDSLFFTGGRGCPGNCTFCARLHGRHVRVKTASRLLGEIEAAHAAVQSGRIKLGRWKLFEHTNDRELAGLRVGWAAVYDEDFFLHRRRAIEFFRLWNESPLRHDYRISLQTNPRSMLTTEGGVHAELMEWIERVKPMVQLGGESFNPPLLERWRKRHNLAQLETVLKALDRTGLDYTVFQLLTDFDSTPEELIQTVRRLALAAFRHRRMRIASSPFTIPLYDSHTREVLEHQGLLTPDRVADFTDYERPRPDLMDPLTAELADLADAQLRFSLQPAHRDAALVSAMEVVSSRLREAGSGDSRIKQLQDQSQEALNEVREAAFAEMGVRSSIVNSAHDWNRLHRPRQG